jgi:hypothetical protein
MTDVQGRFAVFFGKVDRRPPGWYWTNAPEVGEHVGPITGPSETKADTIKHGVAALFLPTASLTEAVCTFIQPPTRRHVSSGVRAACS